MLSDARCPRCGGTLALSGEQPEGPFKFVERFTGQVSDPVVYGACEACGLLIVNVALMLEHASADRQDILSAIDRARRARAIFDRGRGDSHRAMTELAKAFHSLRQKNPPGIEPWDPDELFSSLKQNAASRHELNCAHFILTVWDSGGPAGTFDAMAAPAGWDRAHRAAFIEWAREPWWP